MYAICPIPWWLKPCSAVPPCHIFFCSSRVLRTRNDCWSIKIVRVRVIEIAVSESEIPSTHQPPNMRISSHVGGDRGTFWFLARWWCGSQSVSFILAILLQLRRVNVCAIRRIVGMRFGACVSAFSLDMWALTVTDDDPRVFNAHHQTCGRGWGEHTEQITSLNLARFRNKRDGVALMCVGGDWNSIRDSFQRLIWECF